MHHMRGSRRYMGLVVALMLLFLMQSVVIAGSVRAQTTEEQNSALQPLSIPATSYAATSGAAINGNAVGSIDTNDWVRYDNIDLSGYSNFSISAAVVNAAAQIDVFVDAVESGRAISGGTLIGTFSNMGTNGNYSTFSTRSIRLNQMVTGIHTLYLRFKPTNGATAFGLLNYNGLQLSRDYFANADLQTVSISEGKLEPTFKKEITAYTLVLYGDISQVEVTAQVADPGYAALQINGESQSDNTPLRVSIDQTASIAITVTAEDGTQRTYTITIEHRTLYQDYYVDALNGTDVNTGTNGTATAPWRTLTFACNNIPENAGVTIHLLAGTYPVSTPCLLPSKTNLIGAGPTQTTITSTISHDLKGNALDYGEHFFAIQVLGTASAFLSHFKMDGQIDATTRAHGGIFAHNVSNFLLHDVELNNFNYTAVWLANAEDSHIYNATFNESGYIQDKTSTTGNITIGDLSNSSIHDIKIRESKGAYGIKGGKYGWTAHPVFGANEFTNVRLYHLDIKLRQMGAWNNFSSPNFPIELWNCNAKGVEIFQSWFNGTLSIPSSEAYRGQTNSVHIHHNIFVSDTTTFGATYSYFVEASTDYMEIDHNIFVNSVYPIASFGGTIVGTNIHHNSFHNVYGVSVVNFRAVKDFQFQHNIVTINANVRSQERGHLPVIQLAGGASDAITITENVFSDTAEFNDGKMILLKDTATLGSNVTIDRNVFHQWTPDGSNATTI